MIDDVGGWPVIDADWKENTFNLTNLLTVMRRYTNFPPLMNMYVNVDSKNTSWNTLFVSFLQC
jgi:hypothetical protein